MKKYKLAKRGFSFIEAVMAIAILIFILVALVYLYYSYTKVYYYQQAVQNVSGSASIAANELQSTVMQADHIVASHSFSGHTYTTGQSTLVLEIPSIDSSGNIVSSKYDYAVFYVSGTRLYRLVQSDAASSRPSGLKQLSDVLGNLTLTYNNADLSKADKIDADIQMQTITRGQTVSYSLHQEVYLRNL